MDTLKFKVTSKVISQAEKAINQQQIAITRSSGSIDAALKTCNKNNRLSLCIAEAFTLVLGDNGAIWRAHNAAHESSFDSLYNFLAQHPDIEFTFVCSVNS